MAVATIDDIDVSGRRVLVRVDFNVPLRDGQIADDRRIRAALPTLRSLSERGARTLVATHLGRPRGGPDPLLGVAPLARRLGELLSHEVPVASDVAGESARALAARLEDGEVALLENVRFDPREEANDPTFAAELADLCDLYVNDAFGAAHRAHASTEGVAHLRPAVAGRLMARELEVLGGVLDHPRRPVVAILGGSKISTKLGVLQNLRQRVDKLYIGGAMASTFFRALGAATGRSLVEEDQVAVAGALLDDARRGGCQLLLPVDVLVASAPDAGAACEVVGWDAIPDDQTVVDVGPETVHAITDSFRNAGTVVWNGPLGIYEIDAFAHGTREVARALGDCAGISVIGGGDLGAAVEDAGVADQISFVSTGGGATLEFLEGRTLPGVACLRQREAPA